MCDLWQQTLPPGASAIPIASQIDHSLEALPADPGAAPRILKLYNAGSFFDAGAVPPAEYPAIAERCAAFERVVVECHPALIGPPILRFLAALRAASCSCPTGPTRLEVAMGLETVHPDILPRLNKRMTLEQFAEAARFLTAQDIALRAFVLLQPPFLPESEAVPWALRSVDFAFDCRAGVVTLIPVRTGNGALEALRQQGLFTPPRLATLEAALAAGMPHRRGLLFADLWDLDKTAECDLCFPARKARLIRMNEEQQILPLPTCPACSPPAA